MLLQQKKLKLLVHYLHDGLVSMLLSVLQAPVRNFAYAVKAIGEQKEENAE